VVTAKAAGAGRVVSRSEGRADTSRVSVVQAPARVFSLPAGITVQSFDDTVTVKATLTQIDQRFEQHCGGGTAALRGAIHWRAGEPIAPAGAVVVAPAPSRSHNQVVWARACG
jgi:hypothetical protein